MVSELGALDFTFLQCPLAEARAGVPYWAQDRCACGRIWGCWWCAVTQRTELSAFGEDRWLHFLPVNSCGRQIDLLFSDPVWELYIHVDIYVVCVCVFLSG